MKITYAGRAHGRPALLFISVRICPKEPEDNGCWLKGTTTEHALNKGRTFMCPTLEQSPPEILHSLPEFNLINIDLPLFDPVLQALAGERKISCRRRDVSAVHFKRAEYKVFF